ncbi:MAG: DUF2281 domain-containing protein [Oscillospiraceae bacterium]|nr:DUF2281 domain-containing protein [Oscillospiraceae bacterium]
MQTQVFQGYFEDGRFYTNERQVVRIPEKFKVHLTLFNEKIESVPKSERIEKRPFSEMLGEWSGKIWMADDFDAPLDEMGDYM